MCVKLVWEKVHKIPTFDASVNAGLKLKGSKTEISELNLNDFCCMNAVLKQIFCFYKILDFHQDGIKKSEISAHFENAQSGLS